MADIGGNPTQKMREALNSGVKNITQMKENTAIILITVITLVIIIIAFLYYFYYIRLRGKECNVMDNIYGTLNGKIK